VLPPNIKADPSLALPPLVAHFTVLAPLDAYSNAPAMSLALIHQLFGHISDDVLDKMCCQQSLHGLPWIPPPRYAYDCAICSLSKLPQFRKGKTISTDLIPPGFLLHTEFVFWKVVTCCGVTAVFTLIDFRTQIPWLFCTASKKPPIHILWWIIAQLRRVNRKLVRICVDEDGALAGSFSPQSLFWLRI
jgi:hypothetical protein